jgi:hypothetical protein
MNTKKLVLTINAILFGILTIVPIVQKDVVGSVAGIVIVLVFAIWAWDTNEPL